MGVPTYHDLHITTKDIKRTSIFNLPFNIQVICTRAGGWEVWDTHGSIEMKIWTILGGEYEGPEKPLRLDVGRKTIVNSFGAKK